VVDLDAVAPTLGQPFDVAVAPMAALGARTQEVIQDDPMHMDKAPRIREWVAPATGH
jgi:hypothetical protein